MRCGWAPSSIRGFQTRWSQSWSAATACSSSRSSSSDSAARRRSRPAVRLLEVNSTPTRSPSPSSRRRNEQAMSRSSTCPCRLGRRSHRSRAADDWTNSCWPAPRTGCWTPPAACGARSSKACSVARCVVSTCRTSSRSTRSSVSSPACTDGPTSTGLCAPARSAANCTKLRPSKDCRAMPRSWSSRPSTAPACPIAATAMPNCSPDWYLVGCTSSRPPLAPARTA